MWGVLDVFFPPVCGGCGRRGNTWCDECQQSLNLLQFPVCDTCGSGITHPSANCQYCSLLNPLYRSARSYAYYESRLRNAIHRLKYHRDLSMGVIFSAMLLSLLPQLQWSFDLVIPVPLSKSRFRQRGYNQAALIAYPFALGCGKGYSSKALWRLKDTPSQVNLSHAERVANVVGAFSAEKKLIQDKNILIIDDVYTTGATLNACTHALRHAGGENVYCMTVARTKFKT